MDWETLSTYLAPMLEGAVATVALFLATALLAVMLGLLVCLCRMASHPVLHRGAIAFIEVIRGTPLLVQLFFIYYGMPEIGIVLPGFAAGVIGLTLNLAAYLAELFRAGLQSVDIGQHDAAKVLGLKNVQRVRLVILPQALRTIFPALGNYATVLLKETSLVAVISVHELMRAGEMLAGATFRSMLVYGLVGAIYFCLCSAISGVFRAAESRLAVPGYWGSSRGEAAGRAAA